jgi:hypothetical protein
MMPFIEATGRFRLKGVPLPPLTAEPAHTASRNAREGRYMGRPFGRHARCKSIAKLSIPKLRVLHIQRLCDYFSRSQA